MRHNFSPSHRQSCTSIKNDSFFRFLNSNFYILVLIHLLPICIDDNICWFWAYIYRNSSLSVENSSIWTPNGKMHKIDTRFVESIVHYWSISDRLINSINISVIPKIVPWRNSLIWWITTPSCIKSNRQRRRTTRWIRWSGCFDRIFILDCCVYVAKRIFTIFNKTIIIFPSSISLHFSGSFETLLIYHLKIIILWEIRENSGHNSIELIVDGSSSDFSYSTISININKKLL